MHGPSVAASILGGIALRRARLFGVVLALGSMPMERAAHADPPPQPNAAQIKQELRKLGVVGSVLYIAAHPDDENTNLLAYLANERHLRTAYLSLTRGDGGQNLIGAEQGTDLGVIRTQELLAARRIDGAEQFFTRARDFGYSKNPEETLRVWGHDEVLADVVWIVRSFRPDVIITRFSPEATDTHGHHTASALLAREAFDQAANPEFHPEQLQGEVQPWQAQRIFWNRSAWSIRPGEDLSDFVRLDVNQYNPLLGLSYGEMAAQSRSMHKSQGFGVAPGRGPIVEYFKLLDEAATGPRCRQGLFDGLDLSWSRLQGTGALAGLIEKAERAFVPAAPHKSIPALLRVDAALAAVADASWRTLKQAEVRELILACAGLYAEATAADYRVPPGHALAVTASAINRSPAKIAWRDLRWLGGESAPPTDDASAHLPQALGAASVTRALRVDSAGPLTTPYWLALPPEPGLFRLAADAPLGLPAARPALRAEFDFESGGRTFTVSRDITYQWTDPVAGERYRPVEITPAVSVRPATRVLVLPNAESRPLAVRLRAGAAGTSGTLHLEATAGFSVSPASAAFTLAEVGAEAELTFRVQPVAGAAQPRPEAGTLRVVAEVGDGRFRQGVYHIEHEHIPVQVVLASSDVRLVTFPIERVPGKIGYIPGPGDEVAACLRQVGYDVTVFDDTVLAGLVAGSRVLTPFAAVVVGVRAFNTNPRLRQVQPALLAYVQAGGTLVVQYNTNSRLGPLRGPLGPFPLEIGRERVTDETAAVAFLAPDHRLLVTPNRITGRDFEGWVQERGLYFASSWDPRYQAVLSMADPGEAAQTGALLWARHGRGAFVYTGLAFFRQLPAGVPGAFRLFANLLAAGGPAVHAP
jgi:LmbE family N-acetylglucosaminyl deacetylase